MIKVRVQLPLNASRGFQEILQDYFSEEGFVISNKEILIESSHSCDSNNCGEDMKEPDIMIGFFPEMMKQTDTYTSECLANVKGRFPICKGLQEQGFEDPLGCCKVFGIVPFIMFYNPDVLNKSEIPKTWDELLDPRWKGRIMMPAKEHMAPKVIRSVLYQQNPEKATTINENIICQGMPPNVIEAIKHGEYAIGITNITFGKISKAQNIRLIWPEDGLLCMPQTIIWRKDLNKELLKIGDFLLSSKVQNYLIQQTFIPVAQESDIPQVFKEDQVKLKWSGWSDFREAIRGYEKL